ncbi:MAG: 4-(cytidine 5'-diphospho)-2-C-methyl-D-erythritol kinase [Prevotellaceae bacterium]|jgi:4-diphosphocytidyl-2-C-methyl-D-erythritol kinase|nr:4-(cytidine 5'-diphospho)-2-C-methyl-D-erythritol kinase [Prevotellaceae bacterium]
MLTFPNAKINLGLNVVAKRPDGYHDLETVFYPIPLTDALEVTLRSDSADRCRLYQSGVPVAGNAADNLVVRAYHLLDERFGLPPIDIYLYKQIPTGAGLGGGSADGAYMLKLLNERFALQLTDSELEGYAALLGADCAFFIDNMPVYAQGIGNVFSPACVWLRGYQLVIVKPDVSVSTREAFARITPRRPEVSVLEVVERPIHEWRDALVNDFEASIFPQYPVIGRIKEELYRQGAVYASMSGSGSAVYGLFRTPTELTEEAFDTYYNKMYFYKGML